MDECGEVCGFEWAQEPPWAKLADVVRSTARNAPTVKPSTAPDRLGHYGKTLAARLEAVRTLKAAVDPLNATLSDDQKKVPDELLMSPMGIMRRRECPPVGGAENDNDRDEMQNWPHGDMHPPPNRT